MLPYSERASQQLDSYTKDLDAKARVSYRNVSDRTKEVLKAASWFDIETFGLRPTSPIYETGWAHGMNPAQSTLVSPTSIGSSPGQGIPTPSKWTEAQLGAREAAVPGFREALQDPTLPSQRSVGLSALNQASGRDLVVQNLNFESQFLAERLPEGEINRWGRESNLELRSANPANRRLYQTDASVNQLIADARAVGNSGQGLVDGKNLTQRYIDSWSDVYTKGYSEAFFGETGQKARALGQTRVFDQLDITRSVFALAQKKGVMPATGELNAGLSIEAFARANYGVGEFHGAAHDVHMQRDMFASTLNIGEKLKAGEELGKTEKDFLRRASALQEQSKVTSVKKRLSTAYLGLKELEGGLAEGSLEGQLQRETRLSRPYARDHIVNTAEGEVRRATEGVTHRMRGQPAIGEGKPALEAMQDVLAAFKAEHAGAPSAVALDHDAIYKDVKANVIDPFEARQAAAARGGASAQDAIRAAYIDDTVAAGREKIATLNTGGLDRSPLGKAKDVVTAHKGKIALGAAALYFLGNMTSDDDEYNIIEGLPEDGLASSSRKYATEFGSGYQGPNPWINPEYNKAQDIEKYRMGRASSMGKTYAEHVKSFTSKDEVPEWVSATASAGSILHRIEAAKKLMAGEIEQAEEFVFDPSSRVSGHMDLTLRGGVPADIKTVSEGRLRQVERKGAFKKHKSQLNFYMHAKGADKGFLEYVSRENPDRRKKVWVGYDPELMRRDVKRMESARSTVRRGVAMGHYDSDQIQKRASLKRLRKAAEEGKGETQRDTGFFQMRYLQNVFQEEMEYLRDAKRRAGHKVKGPSRFSGRDDSYNTIEAFRHEGLASTTRRIFGFGSGWTGALLKLRGKPVERTYKSKQSLKPVDLEANLTAREFEQLQVIREQRAAELASVEKNKPRLQELREKAGGDVNSLPKKEQDLLGQFADAERRASSDAFGMEDWLINRARRRARERNEPVTSRVVSESSSKGAPRQSTPAQSASEPSTMQVVSESTSKGGKSSLDDAVKQVRDGELPKSEKTWKDWLGITTAVGAVGGVGYFAFSGSDDSYNKINGFQERGLNPQMRKDFGSGYVIDRSSIPVAPISGSSRSRHLKTRMKMAHRGAMNAAMVSMHRKNINTSYRG